MLTLSVVPLATFRLFHVPVKPRLGRFGRSSHPDYARRLVLAPHIAMDGGLAIEHEFDSFDAQIFAIGPACDS